jgi:hypothetical protein
LESRKGEAEGQGVDLPELWDQYARVRAFNSRMRSTVTHYALQKLASRPGKQIKPKC